MMLTKLPPNSDRALEAAKDILFLTLAHDLTDPAGVQQCIEMYERNDSLRTPFIDTFFRRVGVSARRTVLRAFGEDRFGPPPPHIEARLQAETDPEVFDRWTDGFLGATSCLELLAR